MTNPPLLAMAMEAIAALDPCRLIADAIAADGREVVLVSLGKAAEPMAAGASQALGDRIVRRAMAGPAQGAHPIPDAKSVRAGRGLLECAAHAQKGQRFVALVSGGGSSLAVAPADGLGLSDIQRAAAALLVKGASIDEFNIVRKHLSALKGGRLAVAAAPADVETWILSDVVSGDPAMVASGPTLADSSTFDQARDLAIRFGLEPRIASFLEAGCRGEHPETPSVLPGKCHVVADNQALVKQAAGVAETRGYEVATIEAPLVGSPETIAAVLSLQLGEVGDSILIVGGGEATPTLPTSPGIGGRAQQLALMLCPILATRIGAAALVLGSDGADGPSDGAGALVSSLSAEGLTLAGIDIADSIARFDSQPALAAIGAQIARCPTSTNLADVVLVWSGRGL